MISKIIQHALHKSGGGPASGLHDWGDKGVVPAPCGMHNVYGGGQGMMPAL